MKILSILSFAVIFFTYGAIAIADTPPPGTVKAKMFTGDGNTALTATGSALNVNVTNSGGLTSVDQGAAGTDPWVVSVTNASIPVTGTFWPATQPVSGTLTCNAGTGTQAVSLATLPALTAGSATIGAVNVNGTVPISGTVTATNTANGATGSSVPLQATQAGGVDGSGNLRALKVSIAGVLSVDGSAITQPVSAVSLPLPTGAATESTLADTLDSVNSIGAKTPALGQALAAGSVPVVLTASQLSTLTPLSSVTVSGTVTANAGTGTFTVDASGHTVPVSGTFWQATQPVSGTFWQATQPVSAVSLPLPTGAATETTLSSIDTKTPALGQALAAASVPVVLTASQLSTLTPLSTVAATQSGTWNITNVSGTVSLPTGAATESTLSTLNGKVTAVNTGAVTISSALPAGSNVIGHVIVDTAPTTAVTQSGTWTVQPGNTANTTAWLVNAVPKTATALTVKQAAITIGTSAVRLTTDGSAPDVTRVLLVAQLLSSSTANCYFGSSGVTSTSTGRGVQMFAGQPFTFNNDAGDYYAICDTSSQTFLITEQE